VFEAMKRPATFLLLLGGLLPTGCSGSPAGAPQPSVEAVTLQVGLVGGLSDAPLFIANDRGYFREQAITIELRPT